MTRRVLRQLLVRAGWAPAAVFVFHGLVQKTPWRAALDFPIHFLGGLSIACFFFHAIASAPSLLGGLERIPRYIFAFSLACTTGVFWEFGELFSDVFFHTHIQHSVRETMSDLVADASGAALSLVLVAVARASAQRLGKIR